MAGRRLIYFRKWGSFKAMVTGGIAARAPARSVIPLWAVLPILAVVVLTALPIAYVIARARLAGWTEVVDLLLRPRVGELMLNTLRLTAAVGAASLLLGTGTALLVERTDVPGRRWWRAVLPLPLAVPAFITTYAWVTVTRDIQTFWGAVLVLTLAYFPLVQLPVATALRGLDPAWEESARALGLGPLGALRRLVLPLLRPAMAVGGLLVALHILAEFGALALLRFDTFTTAIFTQYRMTFDSTAAAVLAGVLILLCLAVVALELWLRGRARYARLGSGVSRPTSPIPLGWAKLPAFAALVGLMLLALGLPIAIIVYWATAGSSTTFSVVSLAGAAGNSLLFSGGGALLAVALAVPVGLLVVRHRGWTSTLVERLAYVGGSLPGLVIALALIFVSIRVFQPFYQTRLLVFVAYASMFLPLAIATVRPRIVQAPVQLEEQARALGHRPWRATLRVTLPVIAPGIGAAAALVFLSGMRELTATLLLRPTGAETLATQVWAETSNLSYGAAAPFALLLIGISLPVTYLLTRAYANGIAR